MDLVKKAVANRQFPQVPFLSEGWFDSFLRDSGFRVGIAGVRSLVAVGLIQRLDTQSGDFHPFQIWPISKLLRGLAFQLDVGFSRYSCRSMLPPYAVGSKLISNRVEVPRFWRPASIPMLKPGNDRRSNGMKAEPRKLEIRDSLYKECEAQIEHHRPHHSKSTIAQGFVGLLLKSCRGEIYPEPDFDGKRPDYEWVVAPEKPGSFRFIVEVVYGGGEDTSTAVERVERKVRKYKPLKEHQYYVVALVYEEGTDIQEVASHCIGQLKINMAMDMNTGDITTETEVIPQKYTKGNASLLWAIPFPVESTGGNCNLGDADHRDIERKRKAPPQRYICAQPSIITWNIE